MCGVVLLSKSSSGSIGYGFIKPFGSLERIGRVLIMLVGLNIACGMFKDVGFSLG